MLLFWKKYPSSKFATFISILGGILGAVGIAFIIGGFSGEPELIIAGLITAAIGLGLHFLADKIADR